jgi:hypothetical protein
LTARIAGDAERKHRQIEAGDRQQVIQGLVTSAAPSSPPAIANMRDERRIRRLDQL